MIQTAEKSIQAHIYYFSYGSPGKKWFCLFTVDNDPTEYELFYDIDKRSWSVAQLSTPPDFVYRDISLISYAVEEMMI